MKQNLRLERIKVGKLFGRFNYDISLDNGYNVGILIAPNGCGKTTIFNLVNYMFNPSVSGFREIAKVPFITCECTLSNGCVVSMRRRSTPNRQATRFRTSKLPNLHAGLEHGVIFAVDEKEYVELSMSIKNGKKKIDLNSEVKKEFEAELYYRDSLDEDPEMFEFDGVDVDDLPPSLRRRMRRDSLYFEYVKKILKKNDCDLAINYIRADRLHIQTYNDAYAYMSRREMSRKMDRDPITAIQTKTSELYKRITDEYNTLQRDMKDRLPKMYLQMDTSTESMDFETFKKRWMRYLSNIEKYCDIGLLSSKQTILEMDELEDAFSKHKAFLMVYLAAFEKTLAPLERDYKRLKLFVDILNRRNKVTRKVMKYGEEGIIVTVGGQKLPIECLSSGEKNDFVMFYNLVFDSQKNGLVLIDEPEISLHIEWQEEYLDHLLDICNMNGLQAIVATHSPNIVNGHFELYAERGLSDES